MKIQLRTTTTTTSNRHGSVRALSFFDQLCHNSFAASLPLLAIG